jgi:hypothetical protein
VPDRQLALLSAAALAAQHDWAALQHMAGRVERKSGLTMEHFISAARWAGAPAGGLQAAVGVWWRQRAGRLDGPPRHA